MMPSGALSGILPVWVMLMAKIILAIYKIAKVCENVGEKHNPRE